MDSRKMQDRLAFQEKLLLACHEANRKYSYDIHTGFKIIKGVDEIGCVFENITSLYKCISVIWNHIYPQRMRFACILDVVDVEPSKKDISRLDGPAFHRAAQAIEDLRKKPSLLFYMDLGQPVLDTAISGQINLMLLLREHWSEIQLQQILEYQRTNSQKEVAEKLDVTPQAVSQSIKAAKWLEMEKIEENMQLLLKAYPPLAAQ